MILASRCKVPTKTKVAPPVKTRALFYSAFSDVLQDMWPSCPKVLAIVVSVLPAVSPLPKALIDMNVVVHMNVNITPPPTHPHTQRV